MAMLALRGRAVLRGLALVALTLAQAVNSSALTSKVKARSAAGKRETVKPFM